MTSSGTRRYLMLLPLPARAPSAAPAPRPPLARFGCGLTGGRPPRLLPCRWYPRAVARPARAHGRGACAALAGALERARGPLPQPVRGAACAVLGCPPERGSVGTAGERTGCSTRGSSRTCRRPVEQQLELQENRLREHTQFRCLNSVIFHSKAPVEPWEERRVQTN
jgi:hypothetical protein